MRHIIGITDKFFFEEEEYNYDLYRNVDSKDRFIPGRQPKDIDISWYPNALVEKGFKGMYVGTGQTLKELLTTLHAI